MLLMRSAIGATLFACMLAGQGKLQNVKATLLKDEDVSATKQMCFSVRGPHMARAMTFRVHLDTKVNGYLEVNGKRITSWKKEDFVQVSMDSDPGSYRLVLGVDTKAHVSQLDVDTFADDLREDTCRSSEKK